MTRHLIVNADDFGQSPSVNRGVIEAHERGIVTSASLMVRWPAAVEAATYARARPQLSVGLHVDLGEWTFRDGAWAARYEVVPLGDAARVSEELDRQLAAFRGLLGRDPTHLDSHQHVHRDQPAREALLDRARRLGIPVRHDSPAVRYSGQFYGQTGEGEPLPEAISLDALSALLRSLRPGVTELGCHPASGDDLDSTYRAERPRELAVLCDPRLKALIASEGIALCSFRDVTSGLVTATCGRRT